MKNLIYDKLPRYDDKLYIASLFGNNEDTYYIDIPKYPDSSNEILMSVPILLYKVYEKDAYEAYRVTYYDLLTNMPVFDGTSDLYELSSSKELCFQDIRTVTMDEIIFFATIYDNLTLEHIKEYTKRLLTIKSSISDLYQDYKSALRRVAKKGPSDFYISLRIKRDL